MDPSYGLLEVKKLMRRGVMLKIARGGLGLIVRNSHGSPICVGFKYVHKEYPYQSVVSLNYLEIVNEKCLVECSMLLFPVERPVIKGYLMLSTTLKLTSLKL